MTVILDRSFLRGTLPMSMPSIRILPDSTSSMRTRAATRVLFPQPVRPQTPSSSPGPTSSATSRSTRGSPGRCRARTSRTLMLPAAGQPGGRGPAGRATVRRSGGSAAYSWTRSTLLKWFCIFVTALSPNESVLVIVMAYVTAKPTFPAELSFPEKRTASKAAKKTIKQPKKSMRIPSHLLVASQHSLAFSWSSTRKLYSSIILAWIWYARIEDNPSMLSWKWENMGDLVELSSRLSSFELAL
mmetsp:Transcript_39268/g.68503  ORF Transcript_39268/g.68503 Transcript_39268/m.68503 type:complete len:243 (+) Transcript_39268:342-1070(+)